MPEEPGTISITGRWQGHRGSGLLLDEAQEGSGRQGQCWVECCEDTEAFSDGVSYGILRGRQGDWSWLRDFTGKEAAITDAGQGCGMFR